MKKLLKIFNVICMVSLGAFIPILGVMKVEAFSSKPNSSIVEILFILMFIPLFIGTGLAILLAKRADLDEGVPIFEIKKYLSTPEIVVLAFLYVAGNLTVLISSQRNMILFYLAISSMMLGSIIYQKSVLKNYVRDTFVSVSMPAIFFVLPFIYFFLGAFTSVSVLSDENEGLGITFTFITYGIFLCSVCWQNTFKFYADKAVFIYSGFSDNMISFGQIISAQIVRKKIGYKVIIHTATKDYKVKSVFKNKNRMLTLLRDNGVKVIE